MVSTSVIILIFTLAAPFIATSVSQSVVQGMTAIISAVIGFFFGNRGAERADERVRELENQLAGEGGPYAVSHKIIGAELTDILEKKKVTIEQARKASRLHEEDQKIDAERYFEDTKKLNQQSYEGMKAWICSNYAWLKLDQDTPPYDEIFDMFKEAQELHKNSDLPRGPFPKYVQFGEAIAEIGRGNDENAIRTLNNIGKDILDMKNLFQDNDLKKRDVEKFQHSKSSNLMNKYVKEYLEIANSYHKKKN